MVTNSRILRFVDIRGAVFYKTGKILKKTKLGDDPTVFWPDVEFLVDKKRLRVSWAPPEDDVIDNSADPVHAYFVSAVDAIVAALNSEPGNSDG